MPESIGSLQCDSARTNWNFCEAPRALGSSMRDQPRTGGAILETVWEVLRDVSYAKTL